LARIAKEKHDYAHAKWGNHEEKVYEEAAESNFFDLKLLQAGIPEGVNPASKETYLSDAQFEEVFKMTKDKFMGLKHWKRKQLKKDAKLF